MGLFDGLLGQQSGLLGQLPPWMQLQDGNSSALPPWLSNVLSGPQIAPSQGFGAPPQQQQADAIPPNAQFASMQPHMPAQEPRRSIWSPPDAAPDSPPVNPQAPQMAMPSPLGAPQMPSQPQHAPGMNALAQAPQGQPQQSNAIPGTGGGIKDFLMGTLMGGPMGGISAVMNHGRKQETYNALISQGVDPAKAYFIVNSPEAGQMAGLINKAGGTADIQEFEYAKKNDGYKGTFSDWMASKRAGAGEYGLNPIWGTGPDGKPAFIQPGKNGAPIMPPLPKGFEISRDPIKVEGPTGTSILDPQTRQVIQFIPKDVQGAAKAKEIGSGQGQATNMLPAVETTVQNAIKTIGELRAHPGLEIGTGLSSKIDPRSFIPGQPGYDFQAKNKQAQGQAFMGAREALKGAGQVTDFEGAKGEQAIANLDTAQSKEQYLSALDNLEKMMKASYDNLRTKAGLPSADSQRSPSADGWSDIGGGVRIREKR